MISKTQNSYDRNIPHIQILLITITTFLAWKVPKKKVTTWLKAFSTVEWWRHIRWTPLSPSPLEFVYLITATAPTVWLSGLSLIVWDDYTGGVSCQITWFKGTPLTSQSHWKSANEYGFVLFSKSVWLTPKFRISNTVSMQLNAAKATHVTHAEIIIWRSVGTSPDTLVKGEQETWLQVWQPCNASL